ncbi:hypothetical protein BEWA_027710 [Theileria equi strain WA]|uniref:MerC domain-containing protein n=1 Tax=Theileria equi strain WA TaxID=1537102 RepID=L0AWG6_THEEQ|nr:hypothetical protein BEWA_027710 [Theileria equi strain WA]AFZ79922.1 hypothetical protein BEWA_027710 [Theileria equi strain WA]|eukprot:XP_004829588.1 hypothetical protein BEWA_027710 [Theileria equi strain WA]
MDDNLPKEYTRLAMGNGRLRRIGEFFANYAGIICLIDCIVLPIIIAITSCLNVFRDFETVKKITHVLELLIVIPFGTLSVVMNYRKTKKKRLAACGTCGILVIIGSHFFHTTWIHSLISITGCAMLISSNVLSRRHAECDHCSTTVELPNV